MSKAQNLLAGICDQTARRCIVGTRSKPAETPEARIALMVSGACRKRIAMSMANVPKPTSRIPPSELLVKSSTKVRRARGLCLIDSGTKIQVKNTTNDLKRIRDRINKPCFIEKGKVCWILLFEH